MKKGARCDYNYGSRHQCQSRKTKHFQMVSRDVHFVYCVKHAMAVGFGEPDWLEARWA